jgi:sugar lactone lactonase YvrE
MAPAGPRPIAAHLPAPDDLVFDATGRLLVSDIRAGTVSALHADGSLETIAGGLAAPEGMALAADGRLLVAEQARNRVIAIDPTSHAVSLWRRFANRTGRDGIDGIGPALSNGDIVIPDSPNGVVWRVTGNGASATQLGRGMTRPVGAAVDSTGRVLVADEGGTLWAIDSSQHRFATLPIPDDVLVGRAGHVFVNTLGDNAIHELDAQGHQVNVVSGIHGPQGIALDAADNLYYTEFDTGQIDRLVRTFVLDTPSVSRTSGGTFVVCPAVRRAPGFLGALALTIGSSATTSVLRLVEPGLDSSGAVEIRTADPSITITIGSGALNLSQSVLLR